MSSRTHLFLGASCAAFVAGYGVYSLITSGVGWPLTVLGGLLLVGYVFIAVAELRGGRRG